MPFVNRRVEPLYLSNKVLSEGCRTELENVANNTLANLVRQLADIAGHATSIFNEICAESRDIYDRSSRLKARAERLEEHLNTLDARAVEVPVSTLSDFKSLTDHFHYQPSIHEKLFTPDLRPPCIEIQYLKASTNLKVIFEKLKEYHEDEVTVSNLCQSISLSRLNCDTDSSEYDIEFPRSTDSTEQRRRRPLLPYSKLPARPRSEGDLLDDYVPPNRGTLPTPEEIMRRNVGQSTMVSVDTSGTGFERMQTFRRSLTAVGRKLERTKKKRWRRTISGIPDEIHAEKQTESAGEGDSRLDTQENDFEQLKTMSLDRRSFRQVKPLDSQQPVGIAVLTPIRTRRRPRSLRLPGPVIFPGLQHWRETHFKQDKKMEAKPGGRNRHSVALPLQNPVPTPSPSQGYSSSSDAASPRRRPQSLALPSSSIPNYQAPLVPRLPAQPTGKQLYVTSNRSVPNAVIPTSSVTMTISTRKTSNGSTDLGLPLNELLRSVPTTKVKLRHTKSTVTKEERQSSSGNWSGTDSARTSMNSDLGNALNCDFLSSSTTSPSDSAVSLSSDNGSFPKFGGGLRSLDWKHSRGRSDRQISLYSSAGDSSSGSSTPTNSPNILSSGFTQMDSDSWLQSIGTVTDKASSNVKNAASSKKVSEERCEVIFAPDNLSDSSSSSENQIASSAQSDNGSIDLDVYLAGINSDFVDSDSTSGHSVDHEGYWTSMHSDCGLSNRRPKKRRTSPSKEPLVANRSQRAPPVQPKPKSSQKKKAPPPPIRIESVEESQHRSGNRLDAETHRSLHLLLPSTLGDDNRSLSPSSLTDTASEASTIGSDTTTTPVQTPTDPAMYKLCFGGSSKSLESLDSQLSNSQDRVDAWTTNIFKSCSNGQQANISEATSSSVVNVSSSVRMSPIQEQASVAKFRPHVIQSSSCALPRLSQAQPLLLPSVSAAQTSPTHEGKIKMLTARDKFFGISRAESPVSLAASEAENKNNACHISDDACPESEVIVSPVGFYPETYNTLKRRPKHETDSSKKPKAKTIPPETSALEVSEETLFTSEDEQSNDHLCEGGTVAFQAKKGMDTLQRKRFQDYVSNVQNQAPHNYTSINSLKESGSGNGTQAMTREQREEILNTMRRAKNSKVASSPTLLEPQGKRFEEPKRHELGMIHENVSMQKQLKQADDKAVSKASFRSSYNVGIESDNLDPDLAIIRAAQEMEEKLRSKRQNSGMFSPSQSEDDSIWLPNSQPFNRNSIAYQSFYDTEMCGNSFSHIPSMESDDSYVFDPNLKPKSSILKVKKQGESPSTESKSNGTKHWAMSQSNHGHDMSPTNSLSSLNSIRSITFSDMVEVERTPVRICLLSGKPQTPMDDFKMLLQQHSGSKRGQSACSALNVQPRSQRPLNSAELLYAGSRASSNREETKAQGSTPSRKIVTMTDLRTAMANPQTNSKTGDLGLPYEELQAQNRQKSPKSSPALLTKHLKFTFEESKEVASTQKSLSKGTEINTPKEISGGKLSGTTHEPKNNTPVLNLLGEFNRVGDRTPDKNGQRRVTNSKVRNVRETRTANGGSSKLKSATTPIPHLTESASDSILSRRELMEEIRQRGSRRDSREEAVLELENQQVQRKLSASSMPSLTTAAASGKSLGALLDSMKNALNNIQLASPTTDSEHEQDSGAWE